jgi:hypothetical protein
MVSSIISGGQTGVDRAALDVALELGLACGGWCPKGRKAEDGAIDARYPLKETPSEDCAQRTEWNVRDSDGTLILCRGPLIGGTAFTLACATKLRKPSLVVDLDASPDPEEVRFWLIDRKIHTLNVAGPRESISHGITPLAITFLKQVLSS